MKYFIFVASIAIICTTFNSCKKGDEDPFFSLASRKARISGEWQLSSSESKSEDGTYSSFGDGEGMVSTTIIPSLKTIVSTSKFIDNSYTINKDGTWSRHIDAEITTEIENHSFSKSYGKSNHVLNSSGTWTFLGKLKGEYKNKERVLFTTLATEDEYLPISGITYYENSSVPNDTLKSFSKTIIKTEGNPSGQNEAIYDITKLKSKEMKWTLIRNSSYQKTTILEDSVITSGPSAQKSTSTIVWVVK